jgi:hypothetical protein
MATLATGNVFKEMPPPDDSLSGDFHLYLRGWRQGGLPKRQISQAGSGGHGQAAGNPEKKPISSAQIRASQRAKGSFVSVLVHRQRP